MLLKILLGTTGRPNIQSKPVGPTSDVTKSDLIGKKQKIDQSSAVTEVCSTLRQVVSKGLSKKVAPADNDTSKHKAEVVGTMPPEASKSTKRNHSTAVNIKIDEILSPGLQVSPGELFRS